MLSGAVILPSKRLSENSAPSAPLVEPRTPFDNLLVRESVKTSSNKLWNSSLIHKFKVKIKVKIEQEEKIERDCGETVKS